MELFYIALAISVPIFYLWGFFAFIQTVFGKKKDSPPPSPSYEPLDEAKNKFVKHFFVRVEDNPELTLQDFLVEIRGDRKQSIVEKAMTQPKIVDESVSAPQPVFTYSDDEELIPTFSELVSGKTPPTSDKEKLTPTLPELVYKGASPPPEPGFSWGEWYADHSIDFILYLGAFMIVAAVSLFVGFQWETFDSFTRFGIVLAFTATWFIAGVAVQRFLSLDSVTIAFMTIGAIVIPFNGVAWQRFVVGTMDNVGTTWMITSLISILIYIALSLFYQRRHFTYFGNLSVLATILSLVEITASPAEYYVLAGAVTASVLLIGRVAVNMLAPRLDAYLGQDVENSSLAILAFSVIAGIILIPLTGLAFFSIEVFAVILATLIYASIYLTQHFNRFMFILVQTLGILTLSHALLTFKVDMRLALYIVLILSIGTQFLINSLMKERNPEVYRASNTVGILVSSLAYFFSITLFIQNLGGTTLAIPALLMLMAHTAYFAIRFDHPRLWFVVSLLSYPLLAHVLFWLNVDFPYWTSAYIAISAVQLFPIGITLKKEIIESFVYTALLGLAIAGVLSLFWVINDYRISSLQVTMNIINPFAVLALYIIVMLTDNLRDNPILKPFASTLMAGVSIVFYLLSIDLNPGWLSIPFALSISLMFVFAVRISGQKQLYLVVFTAPYLALYHILSIIDLNPEWQPLAYTALSAVIFFAIFLPEETDIPRQIIALLAAGIASLLAFIYGLEEQSMMMHFTGWLSAYAFLVMLWLSRSLIGKQSGDTVFVIAILVQYYWHILFLGQFVNEELFANYQWYSASLAVVLFIISQIWRAPEEDSNDMAFPLQLLASLVLIAPTLLQFAGTDSLLYLLMAVIYSLIIRVMASILSDTRLNVLSLLGLAASSALAFFFAMFDNSTTLHFAGWLSAYIGLAMLWQDRRLFGDTFGDVLFSIAVYLQYCWHIIFLQVHVDYAIFNDPQWYSASLATVLMINMLAFSRRNSEHSYIEILQFAGSAILMLPILGQIVNEQSLLYFALGVVYSLLIGAIGISLSQTRMRTIASISLVLVVLSQSSDFLLNLPRWIVIGFIGFGLIGAGLYLSIRRRNVKKQLN